MDEISNFWIKLEFSDSHSGDASPLGEHASGDEDGRVQDDCRRSTERSRQPIAGEQEYRGGRILTYSSFMHVFFMRYNVEETYLS